VANTYGLWNYGAPRGSNIGGGQRQRQSGAGGGYGTGFVPPQRKQVQYGGGSQRQPNFSHQQLAGNYQRGIGNSVDTRHNQAPGFSIMAYQQAGGRQSAPPPQGTVNRRFGQVQGIGQGYRPPRRSYGDQHQNAYGRQQSYGSGYSPRTAAVMYGGRPRGSGQHQMPQWGNQTNALTGYGQNPTSYIQQPYGGRNAVTRHPSFGQQRQWNILGGG